jgi:hypothetical protein
MLGPDLSAETLRRVELLFAPEWRAEATRLLTEQCGYAIPLYHDDQQLERIRMAVLKLSAGDMAKLIEAIGIAKIDWRDVLVAAGFGNDPLAHHSWLPPEAS